MISALRDRRCTPPQPAKRGVKPQRAGIPQATKKPALGRFFVDMARPEGFEPPTPKFVAWCSIQLSYGRVAEAELCPTRGGVVNAMHYGMDIGTGGD